MKLLGLQMCVTAKHFQSLCPVTNATCSIVKPVSKRRLAPSCCKCVSHSLLSMVGIELGTPAILGEFLVSKYLDRECRFF